MDSLRLQAVAARVAAWHNHHPLARPITAAHVVSIGYVALPFRSKQAADPSQEPADPLPGETGSLRERATARALQGPAPPPAPGQPPAEALLAAFSEDFIPPLKPAQVARWAARHGRTLSQSPTHAPVRQVLEDAPFAVAAAPHALTLYVLTAAVEIGSRRSRVLLGTGNDPPILGRRLMDWPRLGGLSVAGMALVAGVAIGFGLARARLMAADEVSAVADPASAPASVASAAEGLQAAVEGPAHGPVSETAAASEAASEPAPSAPDATALAHSRPTEIAVMAPSDGTPHAPVEVKLDAAPVREAPARAIDAAVRTTDAPLHPIDAAVHQGRIALPVWTQLIPEEAKAAARAARQAREGGSSAATPDARGAAAVAGPAPEPVWAISTRPLRTRTEAEQVMAAMEGLLRPLGMPAVRTEILAQGDDWRVVGWPYTERREADRALAVLVARGIRVQVIDF
jgi:hypothetical protein